MSITSCLSLFEGAPRNRLCSIRTQNFRSLPTSPSVSLELPILAFTVHGHRGSPRQALSDSKPTVCAVSRPRLRQRYHRRLHPHRVRATGSPRTATTLYLSTGRISSLYPSPRPSDHTPISLSSLSVKFMIPRSILFGNLSVP